MKNTFKLSLFALILCSVLSLSACSSASDKYTAQLYSMDTIITLTAYGDKAEAALDSSISLIGSFETMFDPENVLSDVYELNNSAGEATVVKWQLASMLETASTVYTRSYGAYDISVYPLTKIWGFVDGMYTVPTSAEISETLEYVGFDQIDIISFSSDDYAMVTMPEGMELSFASLAKGFTSDYIISTLKSAGVESAVISLGGNVQTLGLKPDGSNWNVAITNPNDTGSYVGVLSLGETAVVTSGAYQRYFYGDDGEKYHHILSPSTGYPVDNGLLSVTVICESGTMADALSTALFALGESGATAYWKTYGDFDMVMICDDGRIVATNTLYETFTLSDTSYTIEYIS